MKWSLSFGFKPILDVFPKCMLYFKSQIREFGLHSLMLQKSTTPLQKWWGKFLACVTPEVRLGNHKDPPCTIKSFVNLDRDNWSGACSQLLIVNISLEPFERAATPWDKQETTVVRLRRTSFISCQDQVNLSKSPPTHLHAIHINLLIYLSSPLYFSCLILLGYSNSLKLPLM